MKKRAMQADAGEVPSDVSALLSDLSARMPGLSAATADALRLLDASPLPL